MKNEPCLKKLRILLSLLIIFLFLPRQLSAQEPKSIHQIEWELHRDTQTTPDLIGPSFEKISPLQPRMSKPASPNAVVFGFLPYWSTDEYLRYDLLTHVAAFSVEVNENGSLGNDHGWPWVSLINKAHSNGVKVILVATLFDGGKIHNLITNSTYKNNFFVNIKNKMLEGSADGLNVDFESLNTADRGANINNFMAELTEYLHREIPGSEVSFDGPAVNWGGWDFLGLSQSCDLIFIMGYAFSGSFSSNSGPNAPLVGGSINITNTVLSQYAFVTAGTPGKLVLGLPYYGNHWTTTSSQRSSPVIRHVRSIYFDSAISGSQTYGLIWDTQSRTPWYRWHDGTDWNQVWFDDDSSLSLKYDLATENNLLGVGMWALGYDGNRQELWNLLDFKFGSGQLPAPDVPLSLRILQENANALRIRFEPANRATGYFAYLSEDGLSFPDSVFLASNDAVIGNLQPGQLSFVRVRAVNSTGLSLPTEVLAGVPSADPHPILIVNGFDRVSGTTNTLDFVRQHGQAIHARSVAFSSASNESVFGGFVNLADYQVVDWILGDESEADDTFNQLEQERVKEFLKNGGKLFLSGAEIGWDLVRGSSADRQFYANYLKADYISDAPNGQQSTYYRAETISQTIFAGIDPFNFDNGSHGTYDVDWPDAIKAINGALNGLKYVNVNETNGVAGIHFDGLFPEGTNPGKLVHLAVPFETIYPEAVRFELMERILDFFFTTTNVTDGPVLIPQEFQLEQNFPNPFNPSTTISFILPAAGEVVLEIYNMLGQRVRMYQNHFSRAGRSEWIWDSTDEAGQRVSSGTYLYRVRFAGQNGERFQQSRKMILVE